MGDGNDAKLGDAQLDVNDLPEAGDRFELGKLLGTGICSSVYEGVDHETGKNVAIKIQNLKEISTIEKDINEEYRILRDLSSHSNLPDFYGAFINNNGVELWFVMEMCEGGTVVDLVNGVLLQNKKMKEEHMGYILRELVKALCFLHNNQVIHRDIRGSNVLLTKNGEVKLVDFGLSRELQGPEYKTNTGVGSPAWMAPEVVLSEYKDSSGQHPFYDKKIDVWAVGITAIELGDGKPPYLDIHPTRALFQIVRNPPPGLSKPSNWSQLFNDFIAECLEKNADHRPYMEELLEHPFITQVPDNVQDEVKSVMGSIVDDVTSIRKSEVRIIKNGYLKSNQKESAKPMRLEDLAALKEVSEDTVVEELQNRHFDGLSYTFVGDVLLYVNPNRDEVLYEKKHHYRYQFKCRSDNAPHIFSVADAAYQDMLHHEQPQHILMSGETKSGKSLNYSKLVEHLIFLGEQTHVKVNDIGLKIKSAIDVIQAFGNAANKYHMNSTRHVNQTQITYSSTGKLSGALFFIYQLEKWRVTNPKTHGQKNFHVFYDFVEAAGADHVLHQYKLDENQRYRYLAGDDADERKQTKSNVKNFNKLLTCMKDTLEFTDGQLNSIWHILAAILNVGELSVSDEEGETTIEDTDRIAKIAELLEVDEKKLSWSLLNYCVVVNGTAVRRKQTVAGVHESIRVFAQTLYARLFDWIVNVINLKLSFTRAIFGDTHVVYLLDSFGFECFHQNNMDQLYVNCLNEQLQYHYNQRIFAWEMQDLEEEGIEYYGMQYRNNKPIIDAVMNNPDGLFYIFDDATKNSEDNCLYVTNALENNPKEPYINVPSSKTFSVAHYSGTVSYQLKDILEKNRDFLGPEVVETMRMSKDGVIKDLFTNRLTKSGNLTVCRDKTLMIKTNNSKISRWGAALIAEKTPIRRYNTESRGEYSQTRRMRTASAVYRSGCMEILRSLADTSEHKNGVHFVRCMRATLSDEPLDFQPDVVRQQLKALSVVETVFARQNGYSCRISFHEFIQRYKFLAFDFYENVEVTKENCRLLLIRLKMEGWLIGKSKVFLRYYNEEYLSRLYETQVKKIVKVQSMLRAFITKRKMAPQLLKQQSVARKKLAGATSEEEVAATVIQKHYRGYQIRKTHGPLEMDKIDPASRKLMKTFCNKWKGKSIYQVLLMDRASKLQDVVYFSLQVHFYNQHVISDLKNMIDRPVMLSKLMSTTNVNEFLGPKKCHMYKLPFKLNRMNTIDLKRMTDENMKSSIDDCNWDSPLSRLPEARTAYKILKHSFAVRDQGVQANLGEGVRFSDNSNYHNSQTENERQYQKFEEKPTRQPVVTDNRYSAKERQPPKPTTVVNKPKTAKPSDRSNPVLELQLKGKQYQTGGADEDDPPYNFQAILKKTNYKRPSMDGRNVQYSSNMSYGNGAPTADRKYASRQPDAVQYGAKDYGQPASDNVKRSKDYKNELNQQLSRSTRTELLPGIMLEGSSCDL